MKLETIEALKAVTAAFYDSSTALEFSDSRDHFWPGWSGVVERLPKTRAKLSVLDVGCGNGRFAKFLATAWPGSISYSGIDNSATLLEIAGATMRPPRSFSFYHADLFDLCTDPGRFSGPFTLIAAFGVFHHVPSFERRRALLGALCSRLQPGGRLAITFWQFGDRERFRRKFVDWHEYNRRHDHPIAVEDLEEGDYLLRWGKTERYFRYCHFATDPEIEALIKPLHITSVDHFRADGEDNDLNYYLVITR